jgi:hypothetical protein
VLRFPLRGKRREEGMTVRVALLKEPCLKEPRLKMRKLKRFSDGFWFFNGKKVIFTRWKFKRLVDNFSCFFCGMCFDSRGGLKRHSADLKSDCYKTALRILQCK